MVLAVREIALAHPGAVATVGRLTVSPCAINVIPGACVFTIDLRAPDDALREAAQQEILHALQTLAESGGVALTIEPLHAAPAVTCDSRLQALLAKSVAAQNLPAPHLPSGAGHDAMAMAALCPVGMLFLRCAGGISHHPGETVSEYDVAAALDVMTLVLQSLDPADFATN
jgi:allantoate deiminase